jgi:acyl CoA:acetate/3-ketoacid CoA transferase beta subunit
VLDVRDGHLVLIELADGVTVEDVRQKTGAPFTVDLTGSLPAAS